MGKMIAVCGSPESGKTVTAVKLAQEIYSKTKQRVIVFSPDMTVPFLGIMFPHNKSSELFSIGHALDQTDICKEDIIRHIITAKAMPDLGYIGFKAGENKYTYPRPTEDKIRQLLACLHLLADYVVIDCVSDVSDLISSMALSESEHIIQTVSPDMKCMTYYTSNSERFISLADRSITVMNTLDKDMFLPTEEVRSHFKNVRFSLPYSFTLKKQAYTGALCETLNDAKYRKVITETARAVI